MCVYMHILGIYKKQTNTEKKKDKQRYRNSMKSNHGTAPVLHSTRGAGITVWRPHVLFPWLASAELPTPSPSACRETYGKGSVTNTEVSGQRTGQVGGW